MQHLTLQDVRRVKENMPMEKNTPFEKHLAVEKKSWKSGQTKKLHFLANDHDVTVDERLSYVVECQELPSTETRDLWIQPKSALSICLSEFIPLEGKTLALTKTTGKTLKDTRYTAKEVK